MKHFPLLLSLIASTVFASAALAADDEQAPRGWLHLHDQPHGPVVNNDQTAKRADGTAVYGWSYRAHDNGAVAYGRSSCGAYHYWDNSQCVDARHNPPNVP
jgi:hypothetical protein